MLKNSPVYISAIFLLLIACNNDKTTASESKEAPIDTIATTPVIEETPIDTVPVVVGSVVIDSTPIPQKVEKPTRKPAQIQFEELTFSYDTITEGDEISHKFNFTNIGERPLVIKDVYGSCGCTIPSKPFLDIAPNEQNFIKALFRSKGKKGYQKTTVTVETNGVPKIQKLTLEGFVKPKEETN